MKNLSIRGASVDGAWMTAILAGVNKGKISNIHTTGKVKGKGNVGGIVGLNTGNISYSHTGAVVSGNNHQTGGLIGRNNESGTLSHSYSNGSVKLEDGGGGLVGYNNGVVRKAYSVSEIYSNSGNYSGTFIGINTGNISTSYWIKDDNPVSYWYRTPVGNYQRINGSSLEKNLMTGDACGMIGFNFSKNWETAENNFPSLQASDKPENESRNCSKYYSSQNNNIYNQNSTKILLLIGTVIFFVTLYKIVNYLDKKIL